MDPRYPAIADLRRAARRRLPHFVWEFFESATGSEKVPDQNRFALDAVELMPSVLHGDLETDLSTTFLDQDFALPFGMAPVGMSGLIWPGAEALLANEAARANLPYTLSTVATVRPEEVDAGGNGWFQLYPPRDRDILDDMLDRVKIAGFSTLVLTLDVPAASRRERQTRGGLTQPPRLTPRLAWHVTQRPAWALAMARRVAQAGMPRMALIDDYAGELARGQKSSIAHAGYLLRTAPDRGYLEHVRRVWDGALVVKGVLDPSSVPALEAAGVDAIWVSNHAGRQFDGCPSVVSVLPQIRAATDLPLITDGDISGALDILRLIALGADFCMLGKAWHYALAALGVGGPAHLTEMLRLDLESNLAQLGCRRPVEGRNRVWAGA